MNAPRAGRRLAPVLALVGAALLLLEARQLAGSLSIVSRPWDASARIVLAAVVFAVLPATWRVPAVAAPVWCVAAWAAATIAWLEGATAPLIAAIAALAVAAAALVLPLAVARPRRAASAAVLLAMLLAGGTVVGRQIHAAYLGPTHPASPLTRAPVDLVEWAWAGALAPTGFTVTAKLAPGVPPEAVRLAVRDASGAAVAEVPPEHVSPARVARFSVDGLVPATAYTWAVAAGTREESVRRGRLRTAPAGSASFTIAFGACASTGSTGQVFDRIREAHPLLFIHTGDFHYEDISRNDPARIRRAYDRSLSAPAQQALWLEVPVVYTWDDHDYGGNDSDRTTPSRAAARAVYRELVPHYPLPLDPGPVAQAFTIGRVRFIVTDTRSERDPSGSDAPGKSMLGAEQLAWFFDELLSARNDAALIVWVSSIGWISNSTSGDDWGAYADERRQISDFLVANGIRNLVMLAGDAHMLAADDGTNNRYATNGIGPGFPVYHAAALDRRGSTKGGPYSEGAFPGGGQFGLLAIDDLGSEVRVTFSGRNWRGEEVLHHTVAFPVPPE